jgi:hypothetical protein
MAYAQTDIITIEYLPYAVFTMVTNITVEGTVAYFIMMCYGMPTMW